MSHPRHTRLAAVALLLAAAVVAEVARAQDGPSSGASDGPVKETGRPIGEGSGSVRDASRGSVRARPMRDGARSVRDGSTRGMRSGPVSEASAGPLREGRGMYGGGSVGAASEGAVSQPDDLPPLRMERPVSADDLRELEDDLRHVELLPE